MNTKHPSGAFRAEGCRFAPALRELEGIRFFGIDVDYEPGAGYEVFAIWCLEDTGEYIPTIAGDGRIRSVRGTLNADLARAGDVLILPTGAGNPTSPFHDDCDIVSLHGVRYRTPIARQVDAIFFIRQVTRMRSA